MNDKLMPWRKRSMRHPPQWGEKDIQVLLEENMLTIRGEHKAQKETKKRDYHISEMSSGSYCRSVPLPSQVDSEKAKAKFRRGVLTLTLPKTEQAKDDCRRIPVSVN